MKKAKEFQKWVLEDVLPSIRKTGKYEMDYNINQSVFSNLRLYEDYPCFYILDLGNNYYKFGVTRKIVERIKAHKETFKKFRIKKIIQSHFSDMLLDAETNFKELIKKHHSIAYFNKKTKKFTNTPNKECSYSVEHFRATKVFSYDYFLQRIKELIEYEETKYKNNMITRNNTRIENESDNILEVGKMILNMNDKQLELFGNYIKSDKKNLNNSTPAPKQPSITKPDLSDSPSNKSSPEELREDIKTLTKADLAKNIILHHKT